MKKMMVVFSLFLSLAVFSQSENYSFKNVVGTWRNRSGIGLDVVDSNTVYIVNGGERKLATVTLPNSKTNPFTLYLSVKDSSKTIVLKTLLFLVSDNIVQWQIVERATIPASFGQGKGDMLFLRRIHQMYN
ncbi:MAG: hypothetical protein ACXWC7_14100 [Chitinophagaceae bacterium]